MCVHGCQPENVLLDKESLDKGGVEALTEKSRKVSNLKNRVSKKVERAVLKFSLEDPTLAKKKMSRVLKDKGIEISPTGVRNVWVRQGLQTKEDRINAAQEILPQENEPS